VPKASQSTTQDEMQPGLCPAPVWLSWAEASDADVALCLGHKERGMKSGAGPYCDSRGWGPESNKANSSFQQGVRLDDRTLDSIDNSKWEQCWGQDDELGLRPPL
jgi:hypothetical protein